MRLLLIIILFSFCLISNAQCDEIQKLQDKINSSSELTLEDFFELDQQLMELQFEKMNQLFEDMRSKLSNITIVDTIEDLDDKKDLDIKDIYLSGSIEEILKELTLADHKETIDYLNKSFNEDLPNSGKEEDRVKTIITFLEDNDFR